MSPARMTLEGPFSRSVREALESVVSPDAAHRVLVTALAAAGRATVPEDAPPFAAFYEGPLRATVLDMLGVGALEIVGERLSHVLRMAQSQVVAMGGETILPPQRPDGDELWIEDSAVRATPLGLEAASQPSPAIVVALTLDPLLVIDAQASAPHVRVLSISSMTDLLALLGRQHTQLAIVIDTALPSIDVPTVASLASAIPDHAKVLLWGMSERQKERLVTMFPVARPWIVTSSLATIASLWT